MLEHVIWLGGGCGAGKSTLARRLAYRFDLRLCGERWWHRQIAAFLTYLGDAAPAQPRPFPYACECATLGCTEQVLLTPAAYQSSGRALAHPE